MAMLVSLFVHLEWARFPLWVLALALRGARVRGARGRDRRLAREVSTASLMAFLLSLPIAFLALVPANAVSGGAEVGARRGLVRVPVQGRAAGGRTTRSAATSPAIWGPLLHLAVLTVAFAALARLALRRFA